MTTVRIRSLFVVAWLALAAPGASQSPLDVFGTHSGATRRPVVADQEWYSFSALLLTEYDGRFHDSTTSFPPGDTPVLRRHDNVQTSAGYNYFTYGRSLVLTYNAENWLPVLHLPRNTALTIAASAHAGWTEDRFILRQAQDALHDFRHVTRNYRPDVWDGYDLYGSDVEVLLWPETKWLALGGHWSWGSYHDEAGATAAVIDRFGSTKAYLSTTRGWLFGSAPISGARGAYWMHRASVEHTDRYGISVAYSTGIFPDEREFLLAFHVGVQLASPWWLRAEFTNDMLGGKDRGFTGGGRLAVARTF